MVIVLVSKAGVRTLLEVPKPGMSIRLQNTSSKFVDFDLFSIDFSQRLMYAEVPK